MDSIDLRSNRLLYITNLGIEHLSVFFIKLLDKLLSQLTGKESNLLAHKQALVNIFGLTAFNAIGGMLLLLTQVKLANSLGASIFGIYSYCLAIGEIGAVIVRYGRNKTMTRDLIQKPERRTFLITNTFILGIINLALFTLAVIAFHDALQIDVTWGYILLIVAPCIVSLDFQPVYESMRLISWHSIYYLFQKILFLTGVWCAIYFAGQTSLLYLGILLCSSWVLVFLMQAHEIRTTLPSNMAGMISFRNIGLLYKENFMIALSTVFGIAFGPFIRLVLMQYTDSVAVGVFAAGLQIFLISQFFMNQVGRIGNPIMAEIGGEGVPVARRRSAVYKYLLAMIGSTIPFAIPLLLFPTYICNLFFDAEYASLSNYLPIFALYLLTLAVGVVFTQFLISMRKDKTYFVLYISGAILTVVAAYLLIPTWGVLGAVLALCAPHGIICIGYGLASIKLLVP